MSRDSENRAEPSHAAADPVRGEVWLNVAAGLSVLSWAFLGLRHSWLESGQIGVVRICCTAIHLTVGTLFLTRRPLLAEGSYAQLALAMPSFIAGGLAFRWSPPGVEWWPPAIALFALGTVLTIAALLTLGRSFAVLPALREVVVRGPYRWVRHPAYAFETLLVVAMVTATMEWRSLLALLVFLPSVAMRIRAEEQVLGQSADYLSYRERVPWRLVPGVW